MVQRIGVLTAGGDCPGLNAVLRAVTVKATLEHGLDVVGIEDGFAGLLEDRVRPLTAADTQGILATGGTILGSSNRDDPFRVPTAEGRTEDRSAVVLRTMARHHIDALICVGGDGTMHIAQRLMAQGAHIVGVPKTIDNDLDGTDQTFGFDSAVAVVADALIDLHSTAQAHHRVIVVETMGRYAGWLALAGGLAGDADVILIPEIGYRMEAVVAALMKRKERGKRFSIVAVAEGAKAVGGEMVVAGEVTGRTDPIRLGGVGAHVAADVEAAGGPESRVVVLGHLQRAGRPTAFDRLLATRFAVKAVDLVIEGAWGRMAALRDGAVESVSIADAVARTRTVPVNGELVRAARSLGVAFGDEG